MQVMYLIEAKGEGVSFSRRTAWLKGSRSKEDVFGDIEKFTKRVLLDQSFEPLWLEVWVDLDGDDCLDGIATANFDEAAREFDLTEKYFGLNIDALVEEGYLRCETK